MFSGALYDLSEWTASMEENVRRLRLEKPSYDRGLASIEWKRQ